jgi:glycosyltransferase involved in cell wall biosynthesis
MKIGFINHAPLIYDVATPYEKPLGGSESAMCYLSAALAKRGNEVTLFTRLAKSAKKLGVNCIPTPEDDDGIFSSFDILVVQNSVVKGSKIKQSISGNTKVVFWAHHASDQPGAQPLADKNIRDSFDSIVLISKWQKDSYLDAFCLDPKKVTILKNAISPAFENLKHKKSKYPTLVYTSTPFRGLSLMPYIFSEVKKQIPNVKLKVFSSMGVYNNINPEADLQDYGALYETLRRTPGIKYVGSVSQTQLAKELTDATIFAYPNIFPETSCISVMEAMAAGLHIISSKLGALPETLTNFGKLIPVSGNWQNYCDVFVKETVKFIKNSGIYSEREAEFANKNYTWQKRAGQWEAFLNKLIAE